MKHLSESNIILLPSKEKGIALQSIIEIMAEPIIGNIVVKTFSKTGNQENLKYSKVKKFQVFESD
ncbi:MAG TPA: hypothetical protein VFY77_02070 [Nitrososphaeraceae archaeon]|nr:hypothetical protein [Nitrososphaeraceae archaeon]